MMLKNDRGHWIQKERLGRGRGDSDPKAPGGYWVQIWILGFVFVFVFVLGVRGRGSGEWRRNGERNPVYTPKKFGF